MITYMEPGKKVCLIEDPEKEVYTLIRSCGYSRGPMGQLPNCIVWEVEDNRGKLWEFRDDALEDGRYSVRLSYLKELDLALSSARTEVLRAKSIFPTDFHNQHEAYAVILEEVDELWDEIKKNQKVYDIPAQRKEAIQAAAMLLRFIVELTQLKS